MRIHPEAWAFGDGNGVSWGDGGCVQKKRHIHMHLFSNLILITMIDFSYYNTDYSMMYSPM